MATPTTVKITREMLEQAGTFTPVYLSRARAIVKEGVTYPILPVMPIIDVENDWYPEGAPIGSMVILKGGDSYQPAIMTHFWWQEIDSWGRSIDWGK